MIKSIHRDCGAEVSKGTERCWYCNEPLNDNNMISVERKQQHIPPTQKETEKQKAKTQDQEEYTYNQYQGGIDWDFGEIYEKGRLVAGIIAFVVSYIYCIASYGFLFGVGLGWLPSLIVAFIAGFIWPLIVILAIILIGFIVSQTM